MITIKINQYNLKAEEGLQTSDFRLQTSDFRGVECRKQRRLRRRREGTPGPNFLWHVDGWDKFAPFGTFIHEAVDGFSNEEENRERTDAYRLILFVNLLPLLQGRITCKLTFQTQPQKSVLVIM